MIYVDPTGHFFEEIAQFTENIMSALIIPWDVVEITTGRTILTNKTLTESEIAEKQETLGLYNSIASVMPFSYLVPPMLIKVSYKIDAAIPKIISYVGKNISKNKITVELTETSIKKEIQQSADSVLYKNNDLDKKFYSWLNKGEKNNTLYFGVDKFNKEVYTGITKQPLSKRLYQHKYNGKDFTRLDEKYSNLTRNQIRAIEQYLIEKGPANKINQINSISKNSKHYAPSMRWAEEFLKNQK